MKVLVRTLLLICFLVPFAGCEGDAGPAGPAGVTGPAGPAGPSNILAYATVDETGVVTHFGGAGTDSVTVTKIQTGEYDVIFHGSYPGVMTNTDVTGLATVASTGNYNVASQSNIFVTAETTITSRIWIWSTTTTPNPLVDRAIAVMILQ